MRRGEAQRWRQRERRRRRCKVRAGASNACGDAVLRVARARRGRVPRGRGLGGTARGPGVEPSRSDFREEREDRWPTPPVFALGAPAPPQRPAGGKLGASSTSRSISTRARSVHARARVRTRPARARGRDSVPPGDVLRLLRARSPRPRSPLERKRTHGGRSCCLCVLGRVCLESAGALLRLAGEQKRALSATVMGSTRE